ncbi:MAG: hypothetical protein QOG79_2386 [Mycobacterium sp.]|nr:hypothetical protein [Mycobacterium sp.]
MQSVLVTGGTGRLGRAVVDRLDNLGCEVKVLTRRGPGPGAAMAAQPVVGDLRTAEGLDDAVSGASVIVHCATTYGKGDVAAVRHLIEASGRAGGEPHLIVVSIVGADAIPVAYYRAKVAAERMVSASELPWTIQRATQFHDLVASFFSRQRLMPFMLTLNGFRFQPIDVGEVADRLTDLARGAPTGRAPDIGGPQARTMQDLGDDLRRSEWSPTPHRFVTDAGQDVARVHVRGESVSRQRIREANLRGIPDDATRRGREMKSAPMSIVRGGLAFFAIVSAFLGGYILHRKGFTVGLGSTWAWPTTPTFSSTTAR